MESRIFQTQQKLSKRSIIETYLEAGHKEVFEFQGESEVEQLTSQLLEEKVQTLESEVPSRNQVINDIEVKFSDYLRDYYQTVSSELNTLI